ncbi:uncharacterized protein F4822DRAFT_339028 [Hypoxylon trugodes]|uniref:uncharacterized protein n=1 Tax=Hypoxylon trugodes TaxID=326681 RepID=UPI002190B8AF|nr:uncharacterized protein F4822DRAFT_339028 [Hypoxylon trugodes]KAI1385259.1 hypothetical protein F4822DRAFT_339028 [Hypoxylon trugodes]
MSTTGLVSYSRGPLLNIARKTKERGITPKLHIDVVRPGTIDELDEYLKPGRTTYDIVHFDLHGKIGPPKPSESGVLSPPPGSQLPQELQAYLRFAKPYDSKLHGFKPKDNEIQMLLTDDTSLHDVPVKQIAEKLQRSRITKVALSACLSSYAQSRIFENMCYTFLSHDVSEVLAMSFQILESTAEAYYSAFYESLILNGEAFHVAAARGREALRADQLQYNHSLLPTNYHLYPRSFSNELWRSPNVEPKSPPPFAWYLVRYAVIFFLLLALCLSYLWLPPPFFYVLLPITFVITITTWLLAGHQLKRLTPNTEHQQQQNEKPKRRATFEVDIEHLVIEDQLKSEANRGALYIWSTAYSKELSDCMDDLAQMWVLTGFVDEADIIPARVFSWTLTSLPPWRWLRTRRYRSNRIGTIGRRRLLIIKEFDRFYPRHARDEFDESSDSYSSNNNYSEGAHLHAALRRMCGFIEGYGCNETYYLLITGAYDENWWRDFNRFNDERIMNTLDRAVPHNHNITPVRRHTPKWSVPGVQRRWSAFLKGVI